MINSDNLYASLWAFLYCALLSFQSAALIAFLPPTAVVMLGVFVLPFVVTLFIFLLRRVLGEVSL